MKKVFLSLIALLFAQQISASSTPWTVTRTTWTAQDELNYSAFVQALGESKCTSVKACMRSSANPYRYSDPVDADFWSDCADWPYFLRSYFAWKNGLPFAYTSSVGMMPSNEYKEDDRTSKEGNFPKSRYAMNSGKATVDFLKEMNKMQNRISTSMLRVRADYNGALLSDFYSPFIRPVSIRPGTVIYDADGHVFVIYRVQADGHILTFDAHPGSSITYGIFGPKNSRSRPSQGAGFKNFRPMRIFNGVVQTAPNESIHDFSLTQYYGSRANFADWKKGTFSVGGRELDYHEYVRTKMATSIVNPVAEFENNLKEVCEDMKEREDSVNATVKKGFHLKPHPLSIPKNIFNSGGDWEDESTPSRDVRLRDTFIQLQKTLNFRYGQYLEAAQSSVEYDGVNLKKDLLNVFHNANLNCPVRYTNSAGKKVSLSFELVINRLFKLSFDPYDCPERRWGASTTEELASCQKDDTKNAWYHAEQRIRNLVERGWIADQDITLANIGSVGSSQAPSVDVRAWLESLREKSSSSPSSGLGEKSVTLHLNASLASQDNAGVLDLSKELLKQAPEVSTAGLRLKSVAVSGSSSFLGATLSLLVSGRALDSQTLLANSSSDVELSTNVGITPGQWMLGVRGQMSIQRIVLTMETIKATNEVSFEREKQPVEAIAVDIAGHFFRGQTLLFIDTKNNHTALKVTVTEVRADGVVGIWYNGKNYYVSDLSRLAMTVGCTSEGEVCVGDPVKISLNNTIRSARIVAIQNDLRVVLTFDGKSATGDWPSKEIRY